MLNEVKLIGRVGKDAENRNVGESVVTTFSVATESSYKKDGEWQKETEWHTVVCWNKPVAQRLKKGSQVYVNGSLKTRSYETDGAKRYTTEVKADTVRELGGQRSDSNDSSDSEQMDVRTNALSKEQEDDFPF